LEGEFPRTVYEPTPLGDSNWGQSASEVASFVEDEWDCDVSIPVDISPFFALLNGG